MGMMAGAFANAHVSLANLAVVLTHFFFASAGPKVGPVCSDRSGTLRGFTAWLIYDWNPRCSVSGNTKYLAVQRSVIHPDQGV